MLSRDLPSPWERNFEPATSGFWRVLAQGLQSIKIYILLLIYASLIKGITSIDKGQ